MLVLCLLALSACTGQAHGLGAGEQQTIDGLTIHLQATPAPKQLERQEFLVTLSGAHGERIDGAQVYLDLDMLMESMGSNQPLAEPLGNGVYKATTVYTMSGEWAVMVVARVRDREYRAVFMRTVS
jgi:hypothetical protein